MRLLIEEVEDTNEVAVRVSIDEATSKKDYYIEGVFLQADIRNRNGRIYPMTVMESAVSKYITEHVDNARALGELDHPSTPSINIDRVSHKIVSLRRDGSNYIGRAKILDTPNGRIAKSLMDEGIKLGVSSRGLGTLKESNGAKIVGDDFFIVTAADIVMDPSGPSAFVQNIMENKEWVWSNGNLVEHEDEIKNVINKASKSRKLDEEACITLFNRILQMI